MTADLRYPIGPEPPMPPSSASTRDANVTAIAELPARVRAAIDRLTASQLDTPYRPGGWTVRQVVHHLADSHINGYLRLKFGLTEDGPTIKPYDEGAWAALDDSRLPLEPSLAILDGVHERWVALCHAMDDNRFSRTFYHPERREHLTLDRHLHIYAWHARHHVAHITALRQREGW